MYSSRTVFQPVRLQNRSSILLRNYIVSQHNVRTFDASTFGKDWHEVHYQYYQILQNEKRGTYFFVVPANRRRLDVVVRRDVNAESFPITYNSKSSHWEFSLCDGDGDVIDNNAIDELKKFPIEDLMFWLNEDSMVPMPPTGNIFIFQEGIDVKKLLESHGEDTRIYTFNDIRYAFQNSFIHGDVLLHYLENNEVKTERLVLLSTEEHKEPYWSVSNQSKMPSLHDLVIKANSKDVSEKYKNGLQEFVEEFLVDKQRLLSDVTHNKGGVVSVTSKPGVEQQSTVRTRSTTTSPIVTTTSSTVANVSSVGFFGQQPPSSLVPSTSITTQAPSMASKR